VGTDFPVTTTVWPRGASARGVGEVLWGQMQGLCHGHTVALNWCQQYPADAFLAVFATVPPGGDGRLLRLEDGRDALSGVFALNRQLPWVCRGHHPHLHEPSILR
jgi:hypothetical protein